MDNIDHAKYTCSDWFSNSQFLYVVAMVIAAVATLCSQTGMLLSNEILLWKRAGQVAAFGRQVAFK